MPSAQHTNLGRFDHSPCLTLTFSPCFWARATEAFVLLGTNTQCPPDTLLTTFEECRSAKTVLDPGADRLKTESTANAPRGCSRYEEGFGFGFGLDPRHDSDVKIETNADAPKGCSKPNPNAN